MKRQIRCGVFETNSSSVHSLTMCSRKDYVKWENGEFYFWEDQNEFGTKEQIINKIKKMTWYDGTKRYNHTDEEWESDEVLKAIFSDERIKTCEEYFDNYDFETFEDSYTTPSGEEVIAFGYYGHD